MVSILLSESNNNKHLTNHYTVSDYRRYIIKIKDTPLRKGGGGCDCDFAFSLPNSLV